MTKAIVHLRCQLGNTLSNHRGAYRMAHFRVKCRNRVLVEKAPSAATH